MFDHLDDPTPPAAGADERRAVAARAARLRLRRRLSVTSGGTALALAVLATAMLRSPDDRSTRLTAAPPLASSPEASSLPATAPPPHSPAPVEPSARPTTARPTTPPPPPTTRPPAPTASPLPTYPGRPAGDPPPRHSWSSGFTSCAVTDPGTSTAPADSLTLRLDLPKQTYRAGEVIEGTLVVRNTSDRPAGFTVMRANEDDGTLVASSGWAASARTGTDAIGSTTYNVAPGESTRLAVTIRTQSCGSAPGSYEPLPAGRYHATAELYWQTEGESGEWWSPLVPVTLTS
jgi:hypothetical protein